jgi:hypothetical protein
LRISKCSPPLTTISKSHQWGRLNTATLEHEQDYSTRPPSYESVVSSNNTTKTGLSLVFNISDTYGQKSKEEHCVTDVHNIEQYIYMLNVSNKILIFRIFKNYVRCF